MPRALRQLEAVGQLALFVGRRAELDAFDAALSRDRTTVLYVSGPGGVGKTSLLRAFEAAARRRKITSCRIDARFVELTLPSFLAALEKAGLRATRNRARSKRAWFIDTYEHIKPIEPLVLHEMLDRIPAGAVLVVAGRASPSAEWRALSTWGTDVVPLALRNLDPVDAAQYLTRRNIRGAVAHSIVAFSHGHPLALALAADARRNAPEEPFSVDAAPDIVTALYDYFARGLTDPGRRAALEVCAVLYTTTEATLSAMCGPDAAAAFAWLRELSFIELGSRGILPHDLAREVILAELRWRNPERLASLALQAQRHYTHAMRVRSGSELLETLDEFTFVVGHNPKLRVMMVHPAGGLAPDHLRPHDVGTLREAVLRHEGPSSVVHFDHWLARQPNAFQVVRSPEGSPAAFGAYLRLDLARDADLRSDPIARAAFEHASSMFGRRPRVPVLYARFLLACDTGHVPAPATAMCIHAGTRLLFSAGIKLAFVRHRGGEAWRPLVEMSGARFVGDLEHVQDESTYDVAVQDLRDVSPIDWIARLNERTASEGWGEPARPRATEAPLAALAEDEFAARIRDALRAIQEPLVLANSPLVHSLAVRKSVAAGASPREQAEGVRSILLAEIEALRGSPRGDVWHRVLDAAYVRAAGKHENIARDLGMSYTTFRRHLRAATQHIVARIWERERAG